MTLEASLATLAIDLATCRDHAERAAAVAGERSVTGQRLTYIQGLCSRALEALDEAKHDPERTERLLGNRRAE